jgi:hypothetical protein
VSYSVFRARVPKPVKALIIGDVQNDFLPGGALAVPQGDQVIPVINDLSLEFDLVFHDARLASGESLQLRGFVPRQEDS